MVKGACIVKGACVAGDVHGSGACVARGMCGRGACVAGEIVTAADGTHPTGMHSCCIYRYPC